MKVFNAHGSLCLALVLLTGSAQVAAQVSVVPTPGISSSFLQKGDEWVTEDMAHRSEALHSAIQKGDWDLGIYHLEKLRGRMLTAFIKRPTRIQNLEEAFLDSGIDAALHSTLISTNADRARATFEETRMTCMACHTAEKLVFVNDSTVFQQVETFAPVPR